jgi:hypothetical protein
MASAIAPQYHVKRRQYCADVGEQRAVAQRIAERSKQSPFSPMKASMSISSYRS